MYHKIYGNSSFGGIRGTHYTPGQDHVYYVNNNGNSGNAVGQILRIRVTPLEQVSTGSKLITSTPETQINLDAGQWDIRWTNLPALPYTSGPNASAAKLTRNGTSIQFYKYPSAPAGGLDGIDPVSLPLLSYSPANSFLEPGQSDSYYAVKLSSANYGVFRIYKDPIDGTKIRFDWNTYKLNSNPDIVGFGYDDPRDIVIKPGQTGNIVYVTAKDEFGSDRVLAVSDMGLPGGLPVYNVFGMSSSYAIDDPTQPLSDVQQLALYNGNVYVVDAAGLWAIDETTFAQTLVVGIPNGAVGLLIDDAGMAIISDGQGNLLKVDLAQSSPVAVQLPPPVSALSGPSGFLTWTDANKTSFYAPVRSPDNKVCSVDLTNLAISTLLDLNTLAPPLAEPWSVEVLSSSLLFLACDAELGSLSLSIVSNALVLGIGFVPFDYIIQDPLSLSRGKADTTPAQGYFYQVNKVPFGGNLHLMVNHSMGYKSGLRYYRIKLTHLALGTTRYVTDPFTDLLWRSVGGQPGFYATPAVSTGLVTAVGTPTNAFPFRKDTELWYNPYLSVILPTKLSDNGLNQITFEFFDQSGALVLSETKSYVVLIDNNSCNASLRLARIGNPVPAAYPVLDCGCIMYNSKDEHVEFDFTAWQAQGQGVYSLAFYGGNGYAPALAQSGVVDTSAILRTKSQTSLANSPTFKVGHLTGHCTVVGVTVTLSVPPRVIDGYRWLSAAYVSQYFTLVPSSIAMSSPWVDPGG